jgi:16S rRNA (uracil1498-N3)-methyltransferase
MNEYRFFCEYIKRPVSELSGTEAYHLVSVLRMRQGEKVELFDGRGTLASAVIRETGKRRVVLEIEKLETSEPPNLRRIIIAVSIAKAERFDWLIAKCTELGVDRIVPVLFERTVKRSAGSEGKERWKRQAVSACKQCGRIFLPQIDRPETLEKTLENFKSDYPSAKILIGTLASESIPLINLSTGNEDVIAFVGPEGGLTDKEQGLLRNCSAIPVSLTHTILRVETAALAFASVLVCLRDSKK